MSVLLADAADKVFGKAPVVVAPEEIWQRAIAQFKALEQEPRPPEYEVWPSQAQLDERCVI